MRLQVSGFVFLLGYIVVVGVGCCSPFLAAEVSCMPEKNSRPQTLVSFLHMGEI